MKFIELKEAVKDFTVFSIDDIKSIDSNFFRVRLNEWQNKGYIKKLIKRYYIFSDLELDENSLFEIANRIYSPSYISLEMALSYYHLIPESVYGITSVSTRRTYKFETSIAQFNYKSIKPQLFWGYNIVKFNRKCFKIATIEKAILDYFYINSNIKTKVDFENLRIDRDVFLRQINEEKLIKSLGRFNHKALSKRVKSFWEFVKNA